MASALYPNGKGNFLDGNIDMSADTIKVVLIDTGLYTYSASHSALSDVAAGARQATGTLASKTITANVFDAADLSLTGTTTLTGEAVIIYKDSGVEATSWLIGYFDNYTGLPTPAGVTVSIVWDNGASKIFAL